MIASINYHLGDDNPSAAASLVSGIVGGVSAIVSAVLFAVGEDPARNEAYGTTAAIGISPEGVSLGLRF